MLKLTYSLPHDKFQTVTPLGEAEGIWDLWWRITNATHENPQNGFGHVRVHNLAGTELDPRLGLQELINGNTYLLTLDKS